jgi:hypothetical protein
MSGRIGSIPERHVSDVMCGYTKCRIGLVWLPFRVLAKSLVTGEKDAVEQIGMEQGQQRSHCYLVSWTANWKRKRAGMQLQWLLVIPVVFGLGCLLGYLVRAMISRRRRRWSSWERSRERRHESSPFMLRPGEPDGQEGSQVAPAASLRAVNSPTLVAAEQEARRRQEPGTSPQLAEFSAKSGPQALRRRS